MEVGDAIVSFNYDNAFEYVLACMSGVFELLNVSELTNKQHLFLQNEGRDQWIPSECYDGLRQRQVRYLPEKCFKASESTFGASGGVIELIKIHGSINWFVSSPGKIHCGSPISGSTTPLLAYPEPSKSETTTLPLSDVMQEANAALERCDRIVIIGYSFALVLAVPARPSLGRWLP